MQFYGFPKRSFGSDRKGSKEIQRLIWTFQESFSYSLEQTFNDNLNRQIISEKSFDFSLEFSADFFMAQGNKKGWGIKSDSDLDLLYPWIYLNSTLSHNPIYLSCLHLTHTYLSHPPSLKIYNATLDLIQCARWDSSGSLWSREIREFWSSANLKFSRNNCWHPPEGLRVVWSK